MPEDRPPLDTYRGFTARFPKTAMTPERRHADAVEAAHEWRDEQRAIPKRGDEITIVWPGGPRDFEMKFLCLDDTMPGAHDDFLWLRGIVDGWETTLYARPTGPGVYRMVGTPAR